jgi:hypothetical protein
MEKITCGFARFIRWDHLLFFGGVRWMLGAINASGNLPIIPN